MIRWEDHLDDDCKHILERSTLPSFTGATLPTCVLCGFAVLEWAEDEDEDA